MNYYIFDNNYNLVDAGFLQISEKAAIHPAHLDAAHEELRMAVAVEQPGYLMTSLSYDEPSNADVYFDGAAQVIIPLPMCTGRLTRCRIGRRSATILMV